jgi:hypothetical protein
LLEMPPEEAAESLRTDSAFQSIILMIAGGACNEPGMSRAPTACSNMARFAKRQSRETPGETTASHSGRGESEHADWQDQLMALVAPGAAQLAKEGGQQLAP